MKTHCWTPIMLAALLCACGGGDDDVDPTQPDPAGTAGGEASLEASAEDLERFAAATNGFAADLWGQIRGDGASNLVVSPASIEIALAMTYGGARGRTAEQMEQVLHLGDDPAALHAAAGATLARWNDPERETYRLAVANRLFGEQSYQWRDDFLGLTGETYGAPLEPMDFRGQPEPARQRINGWVEEQTNDRIQELIPSGAIDDLTRMVLANAVYFLADWEHQFAAGSTRDRAFHAPGGDVQAPTMHQTETFGYAENDQVQVLQMPYAGGELGMMVVLPREAGGLGEVEGSLSADGVAGWADALEDQRVAVALPKFRVEPGQPLALRETLIAMGMTDAFDESRADLTGMADPAANEGLPLYITSVFHEAFVAVDEEGTEAAAATAVVVGVRSAVMPPPTSFVADHPFLFFIRDLRTGAVLFMGRVADPTA